MTKNIDLASIPSPLEKDGTLCGRWTVGGRLAVRGDLHLHDGSGPVDLRLAAWRYRGSEPLPRFLQHLDEDVRCWMALRHPNLVSTLDGGRVGGGTTCFWVTEHPGGPALANRLLQHPVLAPELALQHVLQVGQGVLAAHAVGLVHGDLDPANVHLVGQTERARLAWGGLATRIERSGLDAGRGTARSLAEVSPEALTGATPTARSDVYGLCALLYRLLAGAPPFVVRPGGGPPPGLDRAEALPPLPSWVPLRLSDLIGTGLLRAPDRRVPTVSELLDRLSDAEREVRGMPTPPGAWAPPDRHARSQDLSTSNRSSSPTIRRDELDPALENLPPSARGAPTPRPGLRSLVPGQPRIEPRPQPERASPPSLVVPAAMVGAAVVLGCGLLGAVGLYALRTAPPAPAPVALAAPLAEVPVSAVLTLRTHPPGAEVWEAEVPVGHTPLDVVLTGGPADPPRAFELRLAGYATHTVRQPWSTTRVEQTVPLQKLPSPKSKPPRPRPDLRLKEQR